MNPKYPNLELIEYKTKELLQKDENFVTKFKELKSKNKYAYLDFDAVVFSQLWGSTCTGFDVMPDGSPAIGGSAMTKEYTTVMHELLTDTYVVFFGDKPCYKVENANDKFLEDLKNKNLDSLSMAKRNY